MYQLLLIPCAFAAGLYLNSKSDMRRSFAWLSAVVSPAPLTFGLFLFPIPGNEMTDYLSLGVVLFLANCCSIVLLLASRQMAVGNLIPSGMLGKKCILITGLTILGVLVRQAL